jgi:uncharacterized membrane protein YdbT with pleckstrin-like domain
VDSDPGEEVIFHGHPSWRSMVAFHLRGSLLGLIAGVIGGLASVVVEGHVRVGWVIVGVFVGFAPSLIIGGLRRLRTTYTITSRRLSIETGLFSRDIHQTQLERVQNVYARQSMTERLLRVGNVDFDTAADIGMEFAFAGVSDPRGIVRLVDEAVQGRSDRGRARYSAGV